MSFIFGDIAGQSTHWMPTLHPSCKSVTITNASNVSDVSRRKGQNCPGREPKIQEEILGNSL